MLNPFVAPVVLPVNRQHHFRSTALETSTSAQLPPKSPGCTDSAGLVSAERPYRPFGPYGLIAGPNRQRLLRRRASHRPAGSASLRLPGS